MNDPAKGRHPKVSSPHAAAGRKGESRPWSRRLSRLLRPRSIAAIGGRSAAEVAKQCERMGFEGEIWPVHPTRDSVAGRPAFRSVAALPASPDAAFVGVNRRATVETVAELARLGAGGAICYASGFLESEDGGGLQRALVAAAGDMPIVGPNCYGLLNYLDGAPLWPDQHGGRRLDPKERGVAIVTQSSNIAVSLTMQQRGLPLAYVVTAGNQAQLGVSDLAAAMLRDERVSALGLHVEGFDSIRGFEALAAMSRARRVPVVVLKTGRSERGRAAALSHTASLAGSDAVAQAFLDRLGIARASSIGQLLETLKFLHVHGSLDGFRLGALCCSGGEAGVVADAVEESALTCPRLHPDHVAAVATTVHPLVSVDNPFDYHTFNWGDEAALTETFTAFARGGFDANLLVLDFPRRDRCVDDAWWASASAFGGAMAAAGGKGAIVATMAENLPEAAAVSLFGRGIAPLVGVRNALAAMASAASIGAAWKSPFPDPLIDTRCTTMEPVLLDEAEAKARLAAFGVAVPDGRAAHNADDAVSIAQSIDAPVALKALGIPHKTDRDAIRFNLRDPGEIRCAAQALFAISPADTVEGDLSPDTSAAQASPTDPCRSSDDAPATVPVPAFPQRLLVERFCTDTVVELIAGLHRDPKFGLVLTLGSGGTLVELVADTVTLLLPITKAEVRDALSTLKCAPMLQGFRGREPADADAAVAAVLDVARFAAAHADRLEELDINPLAIRPRGRGAVALDALIRMRESGREGDPNGPAPNRTNPEETS